MRGDGKDKFYRTLKLDEESRKTISEFNKIKRKMINETKNKKEKKCTCGTMGGRPSCLIHRKK